MLPSHWGCSLPAMAWSGLLLTHYHAHLVACSHFPLYCPPILAYWGHFYPYIVLLWVHAHIHFIIAVVMTMHFIIALSDMCAMVQVPVHIWIIRTTMVVCWISWIMFHMITLPIYVTQTW